MFPKLWGVVFRTEQEDASGSPAKFRNGASHLEKSYPHRELQRVQNHPHCPVQVYSFQVCQISSNQLFLGAVLSFLLLGLFICAVRAAIMGEVLPSLDTFGPIFCCMVSAFFLCHLFLLSILGSMAIMGF